MASYASTENRCGVSSGFGFMGHLVKDKSRRTISPIVAEPGPDRVGRLTSAGVKRLIPSESCLDHNGMVSIEGPL